LSCRFFFIKQCFFFFLAWMNLMCLWMPWIESKLWNWLQVHF
jgi:hypothetical protein